MKINCQIMKKVEAVEAFETIVAGGREEAIH
jgi:hypothetical protein